MNIKEYYPILLLVALTASIIATPVRAAEKPEAGKDRIDTPAIGSGLCVHILVGDVWVLGGQSNMEFELPKVEGGPLPGNLYASMLAPLSKTKTAGVLDRAENGGAGPSLAG